VVIPPLRGFTERAVAQQAPVHHPGAARRAQPDSERRNAAPRAAFVIAIGACASLLGLVLLLLLVAPPRSAPPQQPGILTAGDLSLQIQDSGWVTHDHVGAAPGATPAVPDGFKMPDSMMPGLPSEGTQRLWVEAVLTNRGQASDSFTPEEFAVQTPHGRTWQIDKPADFKAGSLAPGQSITVGMSFDVPDTVSDLELVWNKDGQSSSMSVDSRPPAQHVHG
jgi:hypothetical protein